MNNESHEKQAAIFDMLVQAYLLFSSVCDCKQREFWTLISDKVEYGSNMLEKLWDL